MSQIFHDLLSSAYSLLHSEKYRRRSTKKGDALVLCLYISELNISVLTMAASNDIHGTKEHRIES